MPQSVVLSIDAMGGDSGPSVVVPGVAFAAKSLLKGRDVRFMLHGDAAQIEAELAKTPDARSVCELRHTDQVIASDAKPAQILRRSKGTSLYNAIEAIRSGQARAAVSAGNTGAMMAVGKLILRTFDGLERPAIAASWPTSRGVTVVLDVGANVTADAAQLVDFAILGEAFHRAVHGAQRPTVGLLNVGSEDIKGHEEVREAHRLLRESGLDLDYRGFVEGDGIVKGVVDVVVTDGFTGNVALKTGEGALKLVSELLRQVFGGSVGGKLAYMLARPGLERLRTWLDPRRYNGAVLLGLNGVVVKSHGGADAEGFAHALDVAMDMVVHRFDERIREGLARLTSLAEAAREGQHLATAR